MKFRKRPPLESHQRAFNHMFDKTLEAVENLLGAHEKSLTTIIASPIGFVILALPHLFSVHLSPEISTLLIFHRSGMKKAYKIGRKQKGKGAKTRILSDLRDGLNNISMFKVCERQ